MQTEDQLARQLRIRLLDETAAIEPRADLLASLRRRQARRSLATRIGIVAVPAAAAGTGSGRDLVGDGACCRRAPAKSAVLTAAMVHRVSSESRLALARSGRATISYRLTDNGVAQLSGTDSITFAGRAGMTCSRRPSRPAAASRPIGRSRSTESSAGNFTCTSPAQRRPRAVVPRHQSERASERGHSRSPYPFRSAESICQIRGHRPPGGRRSAAYRAARHEATPAARPGLAARRVTRNARGTPHGGGGPARRRASDVSARAARQHVRHPIYLQKDKNGNLKFVVPSKAFLKEARAMARKPRKPVARDGRDRSQACRPPSVTTFRSRRCR